MTNQIAELQKRDFMKYATIRFPETQVRALLKAAKMRTEQRPDMGGPDGVETRVLENAIRKLDNVAKDLNEDFWEGEIVVHKQIVKIGDEERKILEAFYGRDNISDNIKDRIKFLKDKLDHTQYVSQGKKTLERQLIALECAFINEKC